MHELVKYLRTRLLTWRIAGLWLLVMAAAALIAAPITAADWFRLTCVTMVLIAQLRLWDDLADLPHDRVHHPERVLVRAARLRPFVLSLAGLMIATALTVLADGEAWRLAIYVAVLGGLALLYHGGIGALLGRVVRSAMILAKYPMIALLAAAGPPALPALPAAFVLYALICANDFLEHRHGAPL
jgi:hypothetical protein